MSQQGMSQQGMNPQGLGNNPLLGSMMGFNPLLGGPNPNNITP